MKRRLTVITVCFLLPVFLASDWFIVLYPTELTFPVPYRIFPEKSCRMIYTEHITILVKTSGFKILSYDALSEIDVAGKITEDIRNI